MSPSLNQWVHIVGTVAPIVLGVIPGIPAALIPVIVQAIAVAEQAAETYTGEQKKDAVLKLVASTPEAASTDANLTAISAGIDAVVQATNAVSKLPAMRAMNAMVLNKPSPTP